MEINNFDRQSAAAGIVYGRKKAALFVSALLMIHFGLITSGIAQENLSKEIRWVRQSVEYAAVCKQTYFAAWRAVKSMAPAQQGDWAVVLDIDETVLDNSQYQVELFERGESFSYATWNRWVERKESAAVPGVKAFLDSVRAIGPHAHVAFITNRDAKLDPATEGNLKALGLWGDGDVLMGRRERADTKEVRRQEVITGTGRCEGLGTRTIIALIGDQVGDFFEPEDGLGFEELKTQVLENPDFGVRFFALPNPMYGDWERGY